MRAGPIHPLPRRAAVILGLLLLGGCGSSAVLASCERARLDGQAGAEARCAALRASSWRSSSAAAAGNRGVLGRR